MTIARIVLSELNSIIKVFLWMIWLGGCSDPVLTVMSFQSTVLGKSNLTIFVVVVVVFESRLVCPCGFLGPSGVKVLKARRTLTQSLRYSPLLSPVVISQVSTYFLGVGLSNMFWYSLSSFTELVFVSFLLNVESYFSCHRCQFNNSEGEIPGLGLSKWWLQKGQNSV